MQKGGMITVIDTNFLGQRLKFYNNSAIQGGVLAILGSIVTIIDSEFTLNYALNGAVITIE